MNAIEQISAAWDVFMSNAPMASLYPDYAGTGEAFEAHKAMQGAADFFLRFGQEEMATLDQVSLGKCLFVQNWITGEDASRHYLPEHD